MGIFRASLEEEHPAKIRLLTSRPYIPENNAVSEKFHRTIRNLEVTTLKNKYNCKNLNEFFKQIDHSDKTLAFYRTIIDDVFLFYNQKHVHRILKRTPERINKAHLQFENIVGEPAVYRVRNNGSSPYEDRAIVIKHKETIKFLDQASSSNESVNLEVASFENEIQASEQRLSTKIEQSAQKFAELSQSQFVYVANRLNEIDQELKKITQKEKKQKKKNNFVTLRDPIVYEFYQARLEAKPLSTKAQVLLSYAQFKISCVTLYATGARVNEIRLLTKNDFDKLFETGKLSIEQHKTKEYRNVYFGPELIKEFSKIENEINYVFNYSGLRFLGSSLKDKERPMSNTAWIKKINLFLNVLKKKHKINLCYKSHSFRIAFVNNVLKQSDIAKAAALIGHKSLNTTQAYARYQNSSDESRSFLDNALVKKPREKKTD